VPGKLALCARARPLIASREAPKPCTRPRERDSCSRLAPRSAPGCTRPSRASYRSTPHCRPRIRDCNASVGLCSLPYRLRCLSGGLSSWRRKSRTFQGPTICSRFGASRPRSSSRTGAQFWLGSSSCREDTSLRLPARYTCCVVLVAYGVWKRSALTEKFKYFTQTELATRFGSQNWNIFSAAVLLGDHTVGQVALLEVLPDLKSRGKYPELTRDFITDPGAAVPSVPVDGLRRSCGRLHLLAADTRHSWFRNLPQFRSPRAVPFVRAFGSAACPDVSLLLMIDAGNRILCAARPGALSMWFSEPELKKLSGMRDRMLSTSHAPARQPRPCWPMRHKRGNSFCLRGRRASTGAAILLNES
jgi:hypothetical protein